MTQIFTDYELQGAITLANDFILLTYSMDFSPTMGNLYDLVPADPNQKYKTGSILKNPDSIGSMEYEVWTLSGPPA